MSSIEAITKKFRRTTTIKDSNGVEKKVSIRVLPMTQGITVAKKLLAVIAPAVGGAFDGMRHDDYIHGAPKSFSNLALLLCEQIDKIEIEKLIAALLFNIEVDGQEVILDEYFSANYGELIEILEFALKENFSTFFTASGIKARLLGTIQNLMAGIPQE